MASLFKGGRKTAQLQLNNEIPHFDVLYIGRSQARAKMGRECTKAIVAELVQKSRSTPELQRVSLTISSKGLVVREISEASSRETFMPIYDVTYGAADKIYRNVFSFVTNHNPNRNADGSKRQSFDSSRPFVCHAFVCKDAAMARAMVVYLVRAFKVGFESWKRAEKSIEVREKIRAGPGLQGSVTDGTNQKSSSSGSCSGGTLKLGDRNDLNDLSLRRTVTTIHHHTTPPFETSNHIDKVTKWLDKWLNVGEKRPSSSRSMSSDSDNEKDERGMGFSRRMMEFSDPETLNADVDIDSELADPEVRSVLEEMAEQTPAKQDSDGSGGSQGSTPPSTLPKSKPVTKSTVTEAFLY